jgi:hypothetical protein
MSSGHLYARIMSDQVSKSDTERRENSRSQWPSLQASRRSSFSCSKLVLRSR